MTKLCTHRCRLFQPTTSLDATGVPADQDVWTLAEENVPCFFRKTSNYNDPMDAGRFRTENFLVTDDIVFGYDQVIAADWVAQNLSLDKNGNQDPDYLDYWLVKGAPLTVLNDGAREAAFRRVFATQEKKAPPGIDLRDHLRAYWRLENTSWLDSSGHGHTLTPVGAPGVIAGKIGNAAEILTGQYLRGLTDQPPMRFGNQDFTVAIWAYLSSVATPAAQTVLAVWQEAFDLRGWAVYYDASLSMWVFLVSSTGTAGTVAQVNANQFGPATANTWYLVIAWHDVP